MEAILGKSLSSLIFLIITFYSILISAAGDVQSGSKLYSSCIQCHGEKGRGNPEEGAPKIAGQYDWYIISSIKQFKAGVERKNPKMLPYIKNLTDRELEDLAAYISQLN